MKKFLSIFLTFVMIVISSISLCACGDRSALIKIACPGEYMPSSVYNGFKAWYKAKTGKSISVQYTEFDTNETLYTWLKVQNADYDVVCPSDYMVERFIKENLIQKLNTETLGIVNSSIETFVIDKAKESYDPTFEYSMPYDYGTLGILYDTKNSTYTQEEMSKWNVLFNQTSKKVYMKDSVRDSYSIAMLYYYNYIYTGETLSTPDIINEVFYTIDNTKINQAKIVLEQQKSSVYQYEVDNGKDDMYNGNGANNGKFGVFWSCDTGYIMLNEDGTYNDNFRYYVPEEGSNVWIDNFVIPSKAGNSTAGNLFIQYLCETDVAYKCMDYVGSATAVKQAASIYKQDLLEEGSELSKTSVDFQNMYLKMLFPGDYGILANCGVMRHFDNTYNYALDDMWDYILSC